MPKTVLLNSSRMSSDNHGRAEVSAALQATLVKAAAEPTETDPQQKLNKVFLDGVLVLLSIGQKRWTTKLTPVMIQNAYRMDMAKVQSKMAELGEEMSEESARTRKHLQEELIKLGQQFEAAGSLPENFKLGRVFLIPEERIKQINHIESVARGRLDRDSLEFGAEAKAKFRFINKRMVVDTMVGLEDLRVKFFEEVDSLIADYEVLKEGMQQKYPDQWPLLVQFYPTVETIRGEYSFVVQTFEMGFPKTLDGVDLEELIRKDSVDKEYRVKAEKVLADQRNMAQRQARQFVDEAVRTLRGKATDVFTELLKKISDGKEITEVNVTRMKSVISQVEKMDFLDDAAFHAELRKIRQQLEITRTYKDNLSAVKKLEAVLKGTVEFVTQTTDAAATTAVSNYFQRKLSI